MERLFMHGMIILLVFISCKRDGMTSGKSSLAARDTFEVVKEKARINPCMDPALYESIHSYIATYFCDSDEHYYSAYFFVKDSTDYFTIWGQQQNVLRYIERYNSNVSFNYYWFLLDGKNDVVLITREDDKRPMLFKPCIDELDTLAIEDLPRKGTDIQELLAFRTHKYYFQDGKYHVEELRDTILIDILGDRGFQSEMRLLKKENEIMKRSKPVKDDRPESRENTRKN